MAQVLRRLDRVPSSWFPPGSALAIAGIWGMNQWIRVLSVSVSFSLSFSLIVCVYVSAFQINKIIFNIFLEWCHWCVSQASRPPGWMIRGRVGNIQQCRNGRQPENWAPQRKGCASCMCVRFGKSYPHTLFKAAQDLQKLPEAFPLGMETSSAVLMPISPV